MTRSRDLQVHATPTVWELLTYMPIVQPLILAINQSECGRGQRWQVRDVRLNALLCAAATNSDSLISYVCNVELSHTRVTIAGCWWCHWLWWPYVTSCVTCRLCATNSGESFAVTNTGESGDSSSDVNKHVQPSTRHATSNTVANTQQPYKWLILNDWNDCIGSQSLNPVIYNNTMHCVDCASSDAVWYPWQPHQQLMIKDDVNVTYILWECVQRDTAIAILSVRPFVTLR